MHAHSKAARIPRIFSRLFVGFLDFDPWADDPFQDILMLQLAMKRHASHPSKASAAFLDVLLGSVLPPSWSQGHRSTSPAN